ncbi:MAG: BNR-4 repeat-containing protein, partial [Dehalococcoidia bacterium]
DSAIGWNPFGDDHYPIVSDTSDGSYIEIGSLGVNAIDRFGVTTMPASTEISEVKVYMRAKDSGTGTNTVAVCCSDGTNTSVATAYACTTSFAEASAVFANHPDGSAWGTTARINACTFGVKATAIYTGRTVYVADVWVIVTYTAPVVINPAASTSVAASVAPSTVLGSLAITPAAATLVCGSVNPSSPNVIIPAAATLVGATITPTVVLGSASVTPAASTAVCATVAPVTAIVVGSLVSTLVAAVIAPLLILGSVTKTPTARTLIASSVAPTVLVENLGTWTNPAATFRRKLTFDPDHQAIPADYTVEFNIETGTRYKIATDGCFNESIQEPSFQVLYANGKTHVCYLSGISDVDGMYGVSITSFDHLTQTWGTPVRVDSAQTTYDSHCYPNLVRDNAGYLHLFYGAHGGAFDHSVSNAPDDSSSWTVRGQMTYGAGTYPMPICDEDSGIMFLFFRDSTQLEMRFVYSTDNGLNWSTEQVVVVNDRAAAYRIYGYGFFYDQKAHRVHLGFSFIDTGNLTQGIWYAYSDLESGTAPYFNTWYKADGTSCGTTGAGHITSTTAGSVILNSTDQSMRYFCRYLTLLQDGNPLIIVSEENGLRGPYEDLAFGVARYYSGAWHHTSISEAHDILNQRVLNPTLCDRDGVLHMYTAQNSRCLKRHVPMADGNYTTATRVVATPHSAVTYNYECVDDGVHNMDYDSSYIYEKLVDTVWGLNASFTSSKTLPESVTILKVGVESLARVSAGPDSTATTKHFLRIAGTDYEGAAFTVLNDTAYSFYITYWDINPATDAAWTKAEVDALEFGIRDSDTEDTRTLRLSRCNRIVDVNYATDDELVSLEMVHLSSSDDGDTWVANRISENSAVGWPMIGGKMNYTNDQIEIVWSSGYDIFYYSNRPYGLVRRDARDLRIRWGATEIDRIIDYANYNNTKVRFQLQEALAAGETAGTKDYYVEYGNPNETTNPLSDPNNVLIAFESFETYTDGQVIAGSRGWTMNSGTYALAYAWGADKQHGSVTAGNVSMEFSGGDMQKTLGAVYTDIFVRGFLMFDDSGQQWLSLCDADGVEFGAGKGGLWGEPSYAGYYDGSWHSSAVHRVGMNAQDVAEVQVTSLGCSAWVNGQLIADEVSGITGATRIKCRTGSSDNPCKFDAIEVSRRIAKSWIAGLYQAMTIGEVDGIVFAISTTHLAALQSWADGYYQDIHYLEDATYKVVGRIDVTITGSVSEGGPDETLYFDCWLSEGSTYDADNIVEHQLGTVDIVSNVGGDVTFSFLNLYGSRYSTKIDLYDVVGGADPMDAVGTITSIHAYKRTYEPVIVLGEQEVKGFYVDASILGGRQLQLLIDATVDGYIYLTTPSPVTLVAASVAPAVSIKITPAAATLIAASVAPTAGFTTMPAAATLI